MKLLKQPVIRALVIALGLAGTAQVNAAQNAEAYTSATRYNLSGQVTGVIQPDPDGSGPLGFPATRNTYQSGNLVTVEKGYLTNWQDESVKPAEWSTAFHVEHTQEFAYDTKGRKTLALTRGLDGSLYTRTEYRYDERGRVECEATRMDPDYFDDPYDAGDVCFNQSLSTLGKDRIKRYVYDNFNNVLEEHRGVDTELEHVHTTYTYEKTRLLKTVTDANGNVAEMEYDNFARKTKWKFPDKDFPWLVSTSDYEQYGYDNNGNRTYLRKRDGSEIDYIYDNLNRLQKKDFRDTYMPDVYYGYDLRDLQTYARFGSTSGTGVTTTYTGFGELKTQINQLNGSSYTLSHLYDKNGNRTRVTHPDGKYFTYQYDGLDRLTSILEQGSTALIQKTYDQYARPEQQTTAGGAATTLDYDNASRIDSIDYAVGGGSYDLNVGFGYNPAGQITRRTVSNNHYDYQGAGGKTGGYFVNGLNQYVAISGTSYDYDDNGNLILDGQRDYIYDVENRLIHAQDQDRVVALEYDPNGRLIEYEVDSDSIYFLYDGDNLIAEITNGAITKRYVHAGNMGTPVASYDGSAVGSANRVFLHKDYQGSVIAITDNAGFVENLNRYDAYGVPDGGNQGRFGYTGQMYLAELGLYHYRARVYDPRVGRFLQTDPVGYEDQMNLYAYVHNDPMNLSDPTGMWSCAESNADACYDGPASTSSSDSASSAQSSQNDIDDGLPGDSIDGAIETTITEVDEFGGTLLPGTKLQSPLNNIGGDVLVKVSSEKTSRVAIEIVDGDNNTLFSSGVTKFKGARSFSYSGRKNEDGTHFVKNGIMTVRILNFSRGSTVDVTGSRTVKVIVPTMIAQGGF